MSRWIVCGATAILVVFAPVLGAQSMDESMQKAVSDYSAWMDELAKFTKGVEFDEKDLTSLVEHYPEMQELDLMQADDDVTDPSHFQDNMNQLLAEPEYRSWASRNGLDPEAWLRTVTRITSVYMIVNAERSRPAVEAQRRQYETMVEEQCKQADAETCRSMKEAMAASAAMTEAFAKAQGKLPPPTASERALMEQHYDDLTATMKDDEGPSEDGSWDDTQEDDDSWE